MTGFLRLAYWLMVIVQFFAIWDGAKFALGVGSVIGFIVAAILAGIPLVGAITGFYGATHVWDWGTLQAALLFFWYVPLYVGLALYSWLSGR